MLELLRILVKGYNLGLEVFKIDYNQKNCDRMHVTFRICETMLPSPNTLTERTDSLTNPSKSGSQVRGVGLLMGGPDVAC